MPFFRRKKSADSLSNTAEQRLAVQRDAAHPEYISLTFSYDRLPALEKVLSDMNKEQQAIYQRQRARGLGRAFVEPLAKELRSVVEELAERRRVPIQRELSDADLDRLIKDAILNSSLELSRLHEGARAAGWDGNLSSTADTTWDKWRVDFIVWLSGIIRSLHATKGSVTVGVPEPVQRYFENGMALIKYEVQHADS